jgi:hypothetical protein
VEKKEKGGVIAQKIRPIRGKIEKWKYLERKKGKKESHRFLRGDRRGRLSWLKLP